MKEIVSTLPCDLAADLQKTFGLSVFVETGTAWGDTAELAADSFSVVYTVELGLKQYITAKRRLTRMPNVHCFFGHSPFVLREIVRWLDRPALFWLDAHWSGGGTARRSAECPVLDELAAIPSEHVVMIDDAHMFLARPPLPHNSAEWPSLIDIERFVSHSATIQIIANQILITPREYLWQAES